MELEWIKCKGSIWCELFKVDTSHRLLRRMDGVYLVWAISDGKISVLKVGCGNIASEIDKLKSDLAMKAFANHGAFVTWAEAPNSKHQGICYHLSRSLSPKMYEIFSSKSEIDVNLPWNGS